MRAGRWSSSSNSRRPHLAGTFPRGARSIAAFPDRKRAARGDIHTPSPTIDDSCGPPGVRWVTLFSANRRQATRIETRRGSCTEDNRLFLHRFTHQPAPSSVHYPAGMRCALPAPLPHRRSCPLRHTRGFVTSISALPNCCTHANHSSVRPGTQRSLRDTHRALLGRFSCLAFLLFSVRHQLRRRRETKDEEIQP